MTGSSSCFAKKIKYLTYRLIKTEGPGHMHPCGALGPLAISRASQTVLSTYLIIIVIITVCFTIGVSTSTCRVTITINHYPIIIIILGQLVPQCHGVSYLSFAYMSHCLSKWGGKMSKVSNEYKVSHTRGCRKYQSSPKPIVPFSSLHILSYPLLWSYLATHPWEGFPDFLYSYFYGQKVL